MGGLRDPAACFPTIPFSAKDAVQTAGSLPESDRYKGWTLGISESDDLTGKNFASALQFSPAFSAPEDEGNCNATPLSRVRRGAVCPTNITGGTLL